MSNRFKQSGQKDDAFIYNLVVIMVTVVWSITSILTWFGITSSVDPLLYALMTLVAGAVLGVKVVKK